VRRAAFLFALLSGLAASLAAVADSPIAGTIEARKVVVGERGEEVYLPADEARPQDVIEYRLKYANHGDDVVHNVSITDPVPAGVRYVEQTARGPKTGSVEFSIDNGKTYHAWPVRYRAAGSDGHEVWRDATPDMVTHIRWMLSGDLRPAGEITFSYRAVVK
jgi:uncharacterized repeat protein (TIGR01451 family)